MRFVRHMSDVGDWLQYRLDAADMWRLVDFAMARTALVDVEKGTVSPWRDVPAQHGSLTLDGTIIEAGQLIPLFDAVPGTALSVQVDATGTLANTFVTLTLDAQTVVMARFDHPDIYVLHRHKATGDIAVIHHARTKGDIGVTGFAAAEVAEARRFMAISAQEDMVMGIRIHPDGGTVTEYAVGAQHGLAIDRPSAMCSVVQGDQRFVIVGAYGTSSLTVFSVDDKGHYHIRDHVIDDRLTRFAQVSLIDSMTIGDRSFVAAAGNDGGITLFELLRDGRLVWRDQWIADGFLQISNLDKLKIFHFNNGLGVIIKQRHQQDTQMYHAELTDIATLGPSDQLLYSNGGAVGGAGDDGIIDGAGSDRLTGGLGADIFVMAADGHHDVITDFDVSTDLLDLSFWGMLYSIEQLSIHYDTTGADIRFGLETLRIETGGGRLTDAHMRFAAHYDMSLLTQNPTVLIPDPNPLGPDVEMAPVAPTATLPRDPYDPPQITAQSTQVPITPPTHAGYTAAYVALMHSLSDVSPSQPAAPHLIIGDQGDALLVGDNGHDAIIAMQGDDQLYGGFGNDTLQGGDGNDQLFGGAGHDILVGGAGDDYLYGGGGADRFVFYPTETQDVDLISDFDLSQDRIQIYHGARYGVSTFDDLDLHRTLGGLYIDLWGHVIELRDIAPEDILPQHFEFLS